MNLDTTEMLNYAYTILSLQAKEKEQKPYKKDYKEVLELILNLNIWNKELSPILYTEIRRLKQEGYTLKHKTKAQEILQATGQAMMNESEKLEENTSVRMELNYVGFHLLTIARYYDELKPLIDYKVEIFEDKNAEIPVKMVDEDFGIEVKPIELNRDREEKE